MTASSINNTKILMVEDMPIIQKIHSEFLHMIGYDSIDIAATGKQALTYSRNNYDLILLDIDLPDINGFEVCRRIRRRERRLKKCRTPIIAITSRNCKNAKEFRDAGIDEATTKPVDTKHLSTLLKRWLHHD